MSSNYTHFTNLAFDNLFARGADGSETQVFGPSGAITITQLTAGASTVATHSIFRDTNAGDSNNTVDLNIGNSGLNQGNLRLRFQNALATSTPTVNIAAVFRTNLNSGSYTAGSLNFTKTAASNGTTTTLSSYDGTTLQSQYVIFSTGSSTMGVTGKTHAFQGAISATNYSGTSSGTNTGDVTIGTANGLSLAAQAISMAAAGSSTIGVVTAGTQTFGGTKTFLTALAGSNVASASSSASGVISTAAQSFAGAKTFKTALAGSNVVSASSSASGVTSTATQSVAGIKTFVTQLIGKGTAAVNDAAAGYIGEFITAESSGIAAPTSTQFGDVTNISLTAGDWDISVNGEGFLNTATGLTLMGMGIGSASGNSSTGQVAGINFHNVLPATSNYNSHVTIANYRVSISSTTIYYLKMSATFSGGSPQFRGRISARRIR